LKPAVRLKIIAYGDSPRWNVLAHELSCDQSIYLDGKYKEGVNNDGFVL
jgi:hypothetical protein